VDFERRPFEGSRQEGRLSLEIEPKEARAKKRRDPFRPVRRIGFTRALSSNQAAKLGFRLNPKMRRAWRIRPSGNGIAGLIIISHVGGV
jgi:hypothetical protein